MPNSTDNNLQAILLNSWDRNNRILINLLKALPDGALAARALPGSPTVAEMFTHMHFVRLVFLAEDSPAFALPLPAREWMQEQDVDRIAEQLDTSAAAVRLAVESHIACGEPMKRHYDHPVLFLEHMIWHEGYHHGQIKLALKASGHPLGDADIGPSTWGLWMKKTSAA